MARKNSGTEAGEIKFSKDKILSMKRYSEKVDLLRALLNNDGEYSFKDVDVAIDGFMKR